MSSQLSSGTEILVSAHEHPISKAFDRRRAGESAAVGGAVGAAVHGNTQRSRAARTSRAAAHNQDTTRYHSALASVATRSGTGDSAHLRAAGNAQANARTMGRTSFVAHRRSKVAFGAAAVLGGGAAVSVGLRSRKHVAKAYTPGTITYHSAAARDEGRKKRSAERVAQTGVAAVGAGAYLRRKGATHPGLPHASRAAVRQAGAAGIAGGAALAAGGITSAVIHGKRRQKHFDAAQAGRLQREPAISKSAFGVVLSKSSLAAVDDIATMPSKVNNVKTMVTGSQSTTAPATKKRVASPIAATAGVQTPSTVTS